MSEPFIAAMGPAAQSMPDLTGCVVDHRYQLLTMLGAGAFGVVYRAIDVDPDVEPDCMDVAVKIISKASRTLAEHEMVRREVAFQIEVSHHRNVVQIYDAFEDDDYFYIILDLCKGGSLYEQVCVNETYLGKDELLRGAFLSLIDAVQACHKAHVYHRDLKPENIMTNEDGSEVYLADFGLATDKNVVTDLRVGTEGYMSPECLGSLGNGRPYCTRFSDIWSLGVVLVNMITCHHPWSLADPQDKCFASFLADPHTFKKMLPMSDAAHAILQRIFVLNPLRRMTLTGLRRAILEVDTFFPAVDELDEYDEYAAVATAAIGKKYGGEPSGKAVVGSVDHPQEVPSASELESDLRDSPGPMMKRLSEEWDDVVVRLISRTAFKGHYASSTDSSSSSSSSRDASPTFRLSFTAVEKPLTAVGVPCTGGSDRGDVVLLRPKRKREEFS